MRRKRQSAITRNGQMIRRTGDAQFVHTADECGIIRMAHVNGSALEEIIEGSVK
jgi:hypothetical protein